LSYALNNDLEIHQIDIKSAFSTCPLTNKVTLLPPHGFFCPPNSVLQLKKVIYGLKNASQAWYTQLSTFLVSMGFAATPSDSCVFYHPASQSLPATWVFAHVDDLAVISKKPLIFKDEIKREFAIKYLGQAKFLLRMNLASLHLHINQTQYIKKKLLKYGLESAPPASCPLNPKEHLCATTTHQIYELQQLGVSYEALGGSLNYLSVLTWPNISYAVSVLSQHLKNPGIHYFVCRSPNKSGPVWQCHKYRCNNGSLIP
jgi:hypothetical protein